MLPVVVGGDVDDIELRDADDDVSVAGDNAEREDGEGDEEGDGPVHSCGCHDTRFFDFWHAENADGAAGSASREGDEERKFMSPPPDNGEGERVDAGDVDDCIIER